MQVQNIDLTQTIEYQILLTYLTRTKEGIELAKEVQNNSNDTRILF